MGLYRAAVTPAYRADVHDPVSNLDFKELHLLTTVPDMPIPKIVIAEIE
jgi:hypothetical protein